MKQKKSSKFVSLLPTINKLISEGYTHEAVNEKLKTDHDLVLTNGTFRSYFYRLKDSDKKSDYFEDKNISPEVSNTENISSNAGNIENTSSDNSSIENNFSENSTENKSSFLSQFKDEKPVKPDTKVNKSRNKAKDLLNSINPSK